MCACDCTRVKQGQLATRAAPVQGGKQDACANGQTAAQARADNEKSCPCRTDIGPAAKTRGAV